MIKRDVTRTQHSNGGTPTKALTVVIKKKEQKSSFFLTFTSITAFALNKNFFTPLIGFLQV